MGSDSGVRTILKNWYNIINVIKKSWSRKIIENSLFIFLWIKSVKVNEDWQYYEKVTVGHTGQNFGSIFSDSVPEFWGQYK